MTEWAKTRLQQCRKSKIFMHTDRTAAVDDIMDHFAMSSETQRRFVL